MITDLSQIRQGFEDSFLLDAIVRHTHFREERLKSRDLFVDGSYFPITALEIPGEVLERATDYLVENDVLRRDETFFRLGEHGPAFYKAIEGFEFDGGIPRWDYLSRDQVGTILTRALEQPQTYPRWIASHMIALDPPNPSTTPIDQALNRGLKTIFVATDLDSGITYRTLAHFITVDSLDPIADAAWFKGYVGGVCDSLGYEETWPKLAEVQRGLYDRIRKCAAAVRDLYPKKQKSN